MNGDTIVQVGTAVIALFGAVITYMVVPYLKSKTTVEQQKNIEFWVNVAVRGAEQIYKEKGQGVLKKGYVINFLKEKGIDITLDQLEVLIEAAVLELNKSMKLTGA